MRECISDGNTQGRKAIVEVLILKAEAWQELQFAIHCKPCQPGVTFYHSRDYNGCQYLMSARDSDQSNWWMTDAIITACSAKVTNIVLSTKECSLGWGREHAVCHTQLWVEHRLANFRFLDWDPTFGEVYRRQGLSCDRQDFDCGT